MADDRCVSPSLSLSPSLALSLALSATLSRNSIINKPTAARLGLGLVSLESSAAIPMGARYACAAIGHPAQYPLLPDRPWSSPRRAPAQDRRGATRPVLVASLT
ncbi:hypothetical protein BX600DRAFT_28690 [Xylariales sp. PMI_506]|nr:hypothetical protein BX600DRAFT_28690 [Xylariales sp. PMI_506]